MLSSFLAGVALLVPQVQSPWDVNGPYAKGVPTPESVLGYRIGSRITTFRDQERVLQSIAATSPARMKLAQHGATWEGRPLRLAFISSPENLARLEQIRLEHEKLANGDVSAKTTVPIVWINETIHGNEPASFESGMELIYNLAASENPAITELLKQVVVIVNPVFNPDGHERFAVYYDSIATGASDRGAYEMMEPGVIQGRFNHYRFDMNRDRVSFSQMETRADVREFERWHPQIFVDQHGQVETYFFPPNPMSVNANVDRTRLNKWTDILGRETAAAFDKLGYSYYVKDQFDLYYPGYLDSHTSLAGAIGMTHETDGGKQIARERSDGSILTLRRGAEKHFASALAVIRAAAKNRSELVNSYAEFKRKAVSGEFAGKFQRVVVTSEDRRPLERLAEQLSRAGIVSQWSEAFSQEDANDYWSGTRGKVSFPAGSLVIDMAQSNGPLAKALLEPQSDFEPEFYKAQQQKRKTAPEGETYPGPDGYEFYDFTGWALPYAHNLKAWWCESRPTISRELPVGHSSFVGTFGQSDWFIPYTDSEDILAAAEMAQAGVRVTVNSSEMALGRVEYPRGGFMILRERNDPEILQKASQIASRRGAKLLPLSTQYPSEGRSGPGSEGNSPLRKPNIGVVFGRSGELAAVGSMWYLMDQEFHLPFTPLSTNTLGGDLSKYTCIVIPSFAGVQVTPKLKEWVSAGGSLVVLGSIGWTLGSSNFVEFEAAKGDPQDLPGSLFRAELDPRSFLSYGYPARDEGKIEIAVPVTGNTFYLTKKTGGSVVTFSKDEKVKKLLTGWEFENDTEKALSGTVWLQDVPVGRGHVILFTEDPTNRAMWPGLYKMLLNAMLLG
jgi:hypothetical protein